MHDQYDIIRRKFGIYYNLGMPFIEIVEIEVLINNWSHNREYVYSIIMRNLEKEIDKQINEYYKTNKRT